MHNTEIFHAKQQRFTGIALFVCAIALAVMFALVPVKDPIGYSLADFFGALLSMPFGASTKGQNIHHWTGNALVALLVLVGLTGLWDARDGHQRIKALN